MDLQTAIEIIDNIIKNKEYNEIIHKYINKLLNTSCIISEQNGELIISNTKFDEYLSILIVGPETIIIDFNYCNKEEDYNYHLTYTNIENEIEIYSQDKTKDKTISAKEKYKDNKLEYYISYDEQEESETIKEMFINDENICFTSIEELENDKLINEQYHVNKVKSPYVFDTLENETPFEIEIISEITIKQYVKATKHELKKDRKKEKIRKKNVKKRLL